MPERAADVEDALEEQMRRDDIALAEQWAWVDLLDTQQAKLVEDQSDEPEGPIQIPDGGIAAAPAGVGALTAGAPVAAASPAVPPRVRGFNTAQLVDWLDVVEIEGERQARPKPELVPCPAPTADNRGHTEPMTRFDCAIATMAASGSKVHRLAVFWAEVQPDNPSQWFWEKYKFLVDAAREAHIDRLILTPVGSPNWARRAKRVTNPYGRFGRFAHADVSRMDDWARFVRELANNFSATGFEIWNEQNTNNFWDATATNQPPSPSMYKVFYCAASEAIHDVHPGARVGVGGLAPIFDTDLAGENPPGSDKRMKASRFVQLAFMKGIGDGACKVDFVGYHPYLTRAYCTANPQIGRTAGINELALIHNRMRDEGHGGLKVWITEWGFPSRNFDNCTMYSEARQASLIRREHEYLAKLPYTAFSGYFNLVDDDQPNVNGSIGLLCSNWSPKPSYNAWRHLVPVAGGINPSARGCGPAEF